MPRAEPCRPYHFHDFLLEFQEDTTGWGCTILYRHELGNRDKLSDLSWNWRQTLYLDLDEVLTNTPSGVSGPGKGHI